MHIYMDIWKRFMHKGRRSQWPPASSRAAQGQTSPAAAAETKRWPHRSRSRGSSSTCWLRPWATEGIVRDDFRPEQLHGNVTAWFRVSGSRKQQEMSSRLPRPATAEHAKEKNMIASTATGRAREEEGRSMNDPDPRFLTRSPCAWIYKQNGR